MTGEARVSRSYYFLSKHIFKANHRQVKIPSERAWKCEGMNMDSKNQDNQLYYIDIIIFRVTRVQKNPRNFPHKRNMKNRQKKEEARDTRVLTGGKRTKTHFQ